ncbi:MAG TPA: lycopene cyclase family protein [Blastocatellia bacterium]|nr:lycopene cyclase family protein [Blastocatellia bacterium]
MTEGVAEIAIIGAGPAGAFLASRLAEAGRPVVLFDPKGAWEKPCGGGVPTRALREYAKLFDHSDYPRKLIRRVTLISPVMRRITIDFEEPFAIYSRQVLNGLVLDCALESGARFVRAAVADFKRAADHWQITTADGQSWRARFLVGADGAASAARRKLVGIFPKQDLALAFGYNVTMSDGQPSGPREEVVVQFLRDFTGYVWAFPRPGVMNFGVASKLGERTSDELRSILKQFVADYFGGQLPDEERLSFFGAKIPTLDYASWRELQTTGAGWALIGDAAGFADPITGEGIYYALRSADLMAAALLASPAADGYHTATTKYERDWREAFGHDLERAARRLPLFYRGRFCGRLFTDAMILLAKYHRGVRRVLVRAVVGYQSYATLKRELLRSVLRVF